MTPKHPHAMLDLRRLEVRTRIIDCIVSGSRRALLDLQAFAKTTFGLSNNLRFDPFRSPDIVRSHEPREVSLAAGQPGQLPGWLRCCAAVSASDRRFTQPA